MLITVNQHNAHLFPALLDDMYQLRYRTLVEGEGWTDLKTEGGREKDQFDDETMTYLIAVGDDPAKALGCVRFQPSFKPSLTSAVFPHVCGFNGVPTGNDIYDGSRILVDRALAKHGSPTAVTSELYCGMIEFGRALNLTAITCIVAMKWLHYMRHWNWSVTPLGLPAPAGNDSVVGVAIHPTGEMLENIRKVRGVSAAVLSPSDIGMIIANHRFMHSQFESGRVAA
jgi:N-acyl-L-homoserine lactone synthetase